jgi:hypothetical protein
MHPHTATCRKAQIAREGSDIAICHMAPDPASLLGRATVLPCVPCLQTSPPCWGGGGGRVQGCHVSHGSRPHLPAWEGSSAATCPTAPDPTSLLGGGGLQRCHMFRDPQRVANLKNKERHNYNGMQQGLRVSKTQPRVTEAPDRHVGI